MTRGADQLPISDHVVLRYLQRVCGVDVDAVRRHLFDVTTTARQENANGLRIDGVVYRLINGVVTTCFVDDAHPVRFQTAAASKKILRKSKDVPLHQLMEE